VCSFISRQEHRADSVEIRILTPKVKQGARLATFFVLSYVAEAVSSVFPFQSVTEAQTFDDEGEPLTIRVSDGVASDYSSLPSANDLDVLFCACFSTEYLMKRGPCGDKASLVVWTHTTKRCPHVHPWNPYGRARACIRPTTGASCVDVR
jgi:hypothetical protein